MMPNLFLVSALRLPGQSVATRNRTDCITFVLCCRKPHEFCAAERQSSPTRSLRQRLDVRRNRNGGTSRRRLLVRLCLGRSEGHELAPALLLLLLNVSIDRVQIVIESGGVSVTHSPHFVDNGVVHGFVSKSSSGVQMI